MKQRMIVMNGQRIIQGERDGQWQNEKIGRAAGSLKPGIYNLHTAIPARAGEAHSGTILHSDEQSVYQQVGKQVVMHAKEAFHRVPDIGSAATIVYDGQGSATT